MSLLSKDLATLNAGSNYKFSATKINSLGASEYTLVTLVVDASSSVDAFAAQLEQTIKTVFKSCEKSPRKDNLMFRVVQFSNTPTELHGFKLLSTINEDDYTGILKVGGMTALLEAADEAVLATGTYGKQLTSMEYLVNGIVFVATDGENNCGNISLPDRLKQSIVGVRRAENLESFRVVLIGVTNDDVNLNTYLQTLKDDGGFDQYISIGKVSPGKLAKLADFISQSISSTSSALGTGAPSAPINPTGFKF